MSGYGTDAHAVRFGVPCTINGYGVELTFDNIPSKCYVNGETVNVSGRLLNIGVFGDFKATLCSSLDGKDPIKTISGFLKDYSGAKYVDLAATEPKITASDIKSVIIIGSKPKFPSGTPEPNKDNNNKESSSSPMTIGIIVGVSVLVIGVGIGIYLYNKPNSENVISSDESSSGGYYRYR
jgi:hypothetical protein